MWTRPVPSSVVTNPSFRTPERGSVGEIGEERFVAPSFDIGTLEARDDLVLVSALVVTATRRA
jgi:hypothetical protein